MLPLRTLIFTLIVLLQCNGSVQASTFEASTDQVKAQLITSVDAVHPGDEILVGVQERIIPHWHTYWINPGDSGLPTTIDYVLPKGSTVEGIQWPTPSRIVLGPVTNYGYENEVILLSKLKVPEDIQAGSEFPIQAKVKWLVCDEICIPQKVDLALNLPAVLPGIASGNGSPLIKAAQTTLPTTSPWPYSIVKSENTLAIRLTDTQFNKSNIKNVWFYPEKWGKIVHNAEQPWKISGDTLEIQLKSGDEPLTSDEKLSGVLSVTIDGPEGSVTQGYQLSANALAVPTISAIDAKAPDLVLSSALFLALLGGIVLNLMPCVFPVLSIKAIALIKHANHDPLENKLHGLAYTLGILVSFALLGTLLIILKAGGAQIGWGFQFQSPLFVLGVAYLMFTVGLSLSGVFSIGGSVMGIGSSLANRSGYSGSFFTGVLATVVATPCTAPFMGAALGFALTQPPAILLAVFLSLGLGLALPYLILSQWPSLQRRLPKPGVWMDRLKQGLAFPMYAAAVWLVWVLAQQAGINSVAIALGGMVVIAFSAWLYESTKTGIKSTQRSGASVAGLSLWLALIGSYLGIDASPASPISNAESSNVYEAYSPARLNELRAAGKPVFLNLTAAWCISCLVNEKVALSQCSVIQAFKEADITYLKGDWTNRNDEITQLLSEFGRSGVPLYVYYPGKNSALKSPIVLPQVLTPDLVIRTIKPSLMREKEV